MTYHSLGNPPAPPRTYGYFKFVDESSYEPWKRVPNAGNVLPEPRDIRTFGSPMFVSYNYLGDAGVRVTVRGKTRVKEFSLPDSFVQQALAFFEGIPSTIPRLTEEQVSAELSAPGTLPGASKSPSDSKTVTARSSLPIVLGIGAGSLLLLVGLGMAFRKRA